MTCRKVIPIGGYDLILFNNGPSGQGREVNLVRRHTLTSNVIDSEHKIFSVEKWEALISKFEEVMNREPQEYCFNQYHAGETNGNFQVRITGNKVGHWGQRVYFEMDRKEADCGIWIEFGKENIINFIAQNEEVLRFFKNGLPSHCHCRFSDIPYILTRCFYDISNYSSAF